MKVAVVTGGGNGLGRQIALGLGARGYAVVVTDIDSDAAARVAREIGPSAQAAVHDVRDAEAHERIAEMAAELGPVSLWVNNAGVLRSGHVWEQEPEELRLHSDVNFLGVMFGCRAAVRCMRAKGGHILNIASLSSFLPAPGIAAYGASKHAVLGFSLSLQGELEAAGIAIRVSALCPDVFDTELVRQVRGRSEASLLFAREPLTTESVAREALALVERPRLVRAYPNPWAFLARISQPIPSLALQVLGRMRKRGDARRERD